MAYTARWGPKGFLVSPTKVVQFLDFTTTVSLKANSENDTSGTAPTNTRGRELQPMSFEIPYIAAAGVDPRAQFDEWTAQIGNSYPFYIGEERFGPPQMTLHSVEMSDVQLTILGKFISCKITISLKEYSEGKKTALKSGTTSQKSAKSSSLVSNEEAAKILEKQKAKAAAATASKADRATTKPYKVGGYVV